MQHHGYLSILVLLCIGLTVSNVSAGNNDRPGLTLIEKDMLCVCRYFNNTEVGDKDDFCSSIGFTQRWEPLFPGRVELGIGVGGLRALVFRSKTQTSVVAIGFREFLHDKVDFFIDDDWFQSIAMFGSEVLPKEYEGTLAHVLAGFMYYFRLYLGFDYHKHASSFVDEILAHGKAQRDPIFTGQGFGGSIATLQALRKDQSSGVTFGAHGVGKLADSYGYPNQTRRVTNLVLSTQSLIGVQATRQCTFETPQPFLLSGEMNAVKSPMGFSQIKTARTCSDPS